MKIVFVAFKDSLNFERTIEMYLINPTKTGEKYGIFSVVDTTDGTEERMTREEIDALIEAGIKIQGYEEAKKAQEDTKNQIDDLKKEYGKDNVSTDFFNLPDEDLKAVNVDGKKDVIESIEKSIEDKIKSKKITRTSELSAHLKGECLYANKKGLLDEKEINTVRVPLETAIIKRHPELVTNEADYVAKQKELKKKKSEVFNSQLNQSKQIAGTVENGSDLDFTLYVFTVVGVIMDDDTVKAYNMVSNISDNVMYLTVELLQKTMASTKLKVQFTNAIYDKATGLLKTTKGIGLEHIYPKIEPDFSLRNVNGLTITSLILDDETDLILGAICFDGFGVRYNYTLQSILTYITKGNLNCNFKIQTGTIIPKHCINGFEFPQVHMSIPKPEAVYNSKFGDKKPYVIVEDNDCSPMITQRVYAFDELTDNAFMVSGEEKYQWACYSLKKIAPYYYTMFQAIDKIPVIGFGTMGVTEDKMIIDYQFLSQCSVAELTYLFIHEINHIVMQHSVRQGRRNHELWNIACDLYINTIINKDYDCHPGGPVSEIYLEEYEDENGDKKLRPAITHPSDANKGADMKDFKNNTKSGFIKCPTYGIFLESVGETLDLGVETVERIYDKLATENISMLENKEDKKNSSGTSSGTSSANDSNNSNNNTNANSNANSNQPMSQEEKNSIQSAISQVQEGIKDGLEICENSKASREASNKVQSGIQTIQEGLKTDNRDMIQKGYEKMQDGISDMQSAMNEKNIADSAQRIQESIQEAAKRTGMTGNLAEMSKQVKSSTSEIRQGILNNDIRKTMTGKDRLNNGMDKSLSEDMWNKQNVQDLKESIQQELNNINESASVNTLQEGIKELRDGAKQSLELAPDVDSVKGSYDAVNNSISVMRKGYESGNTELINQGIQIAEKATQNLADVSYNAHTQHLTRELNENFSVLKDKCVNNGISDEDLSELSDNFNDLLQEVDRKKFEKFTGLVKKKMGSSAKDADAQTALIDLKRGYEDICEIKLN